MELLRTIVNVHQKKIIQKEVLDKVILVESLLVCHQQILDLESGHLADHIDVIGLALHQYNIFQLVLVKYLEKLIALQHLALRQRLGEHEHRLFILFHRIQRGCQRLALGVHHT